MALKGLRSGIIGGQPITGTTITATGQILTKNGTNASPAIAPSGQTGFGLFFDSSNRMFMGRGGATGNTWYFDGGSNIQAFSGANVSLQLQANSSVVAFGASSDVGLSRIAAGVLGAGTGGIGSVAGSLKATDLYTSNATYLIRGLTTLTDVAGASVGTLTNAPSVGNPTKWIGIDDAGTLRKFPTWI